MFGIVMKQTEDRIVILCEDGSFRNLTAAGRYVTLGERIEVPDVREVLVKPKSRFAALGRLKGLLTPLIALKGLLPNGLGSFKRGMLASAAAAVFIMVVGLAFVLKSTGVSAEPVALVAVDINPSIELFVNAKGKVNKAALVNDDAKWLIGAEELNGEDLYTALQRIIQKAEEQGYLNAETEKTIVLLSVLDLGDKTFEVDKTKITMPSVQYSVELYYVNEQERDTAQKRGLTVNKYIVMEQAKDMGVELNEEQLKTHSVVTVLSSAGVSPKKFFEDNQASNKHKPKTKSDPKATINPVKLDPKKDDSKENSKGKDKNDDKSGAKSDDKGDDKQSSKQSDKQSGEQGSDQGNKQNAKDDKSENEKNNKNDKNDHNNKDDNRDNNRNKDWNHSNDRNRNGDNNDSKDNKKDD